jgi:hypothetical protein
MKNEFWDNLIEGYKREKRVHWLEIIIRWVLYVIVVGLVITLITL